MTPELTKATEITKTRLAQWRKRNKDEGVACTPIVLINSIHGDQSGIILNMVTEAPLRDVLQIMEAACEQVRKKINQEINGQSTV